MNSDASAEGRSKDLSDAQSILDVAIGFLGRLGFAFQVDRAGGPVQLGDVALLSLIMILENVMSTSIRDHVTTLPEMSTWRDVESLIAMVQDSQAKQLKPRNRGTPKPASKRCGRWIDLVPYSDDSAALAYFLALEQPNLFRDRYGAFIPPPALFQRTKYEGSLSVLTINRGGTTQPIGLARAFLANEWSGWVRVSWAVGARDRFLGLDADILSTLSTYLFSSWSFRKLYIHIPHYQLGAFEDAIRLGFLQEEGRLKDHIYFSGGLHDEIILAMYRDMSMERGIQTLASESTGRSLPG